MTAVLLLSGASGRDDAFHDFDATSAAIAEILRSAGLDVRVRDVAAVEAAEFADVDVLVANCGLHSPPGVDAAATAAFVNLIASTCPVLALHTSAGAFAGVAQWIDRIGVQWVPGRSTHPPIGQIAVSANESHPIGAGLGVVDVFDERYSYLDIAQPGDTVLSHHLDGIEHPLSLVRQDPDGRRTVYDALGHGVESYRSPSRRELLLREFDWLLGQEVGAAAADLRSHVGGGARPDG